MVKIKDQIKKIIFGTETFSGRLFDILLIFAITTSVLIVMLDSVSEYHNTYGKVFIQIEWVFTILFTLE
jgi:voltage-gated potassium channel